MSDLIIPSRRGFLSGSLCLLAAPAIVRAASLMPIKAEVPLLVINRIGGNTMLTINQITREAVRLWQKSNSFIKNLELEYDATYKFLSGSQWTPDQAQAMSSALRLKIQH